MIRAERERRRSTKQAAKDERSRQAEIEYCGGSPEGIIHWFDNYVWTYDPRLIGKHDSEGRKLSPYIPFVLWPKQREMIRFLWDRLEAEEEFLIEKSRDTGASYVCCGFSLNRWLFADGFKATFGSRKVDLVDQSDQPDSLFEKIRIMLDRLPDWMLPPDFNRKKNSNYLRLFNPTTGAIISGEGGEDMGRGGRSSIYLLDEAAKIPNAEEVERALSGNTDCIGWISTPSGMGNLFARKRHSILRPEQVFRIHYSDDPRRDQAWVDKKRSQISSEAAWASEYEIDYTASLEGVCIPAKWVAAAQRLAKLDSAATRSREEFTIGLDVGAGKAKSVAIAKRGPIVIPPISRGNPDTIGTAAWALEYALDLQARLMNFDSPGVGVGVSSALLHSEQRPKALDVQPVNTGDAPQEIIWEDGRSSEEQFANLKAEIWWLARTAFKRTFEHVQWLEGGLPEDGARQHRVSELIALPSGDPESDKLAVELSSVKFFHNTKGKVIIESKDQLAKRGIKSPDYADAFVLLYVGNRGEEYTLDHL